MFDDDFQRSQHILFHMLSDNIKSSYNAILAKSQLLKTIDFNKNYFCGVYEDRKYDSTFWGRFRISTYKNVIELSLTTDEDSCLEIHYIPADALYLLDENLLLNYFLKVFNNDYQLRYSIDS